MEAPAAAARSSVKRLYPPEQPQESAAPFVLSGTHALLFDDDTLAAFINSAEALLPWNGDQSLLIDRYDVRHLLQDLSNVRRRRPAPPLTDATEEQLNYERFRDLRETLRSSTPEGNAKDPAECLKPSGGGYQAVPFSYSINATENASQAESTHRSLGYHPPFPVPDHLVSKMPETEKLQQIIAGTAKFVKEHGGQSEVLLKVKQGNNPMFGFLNVDHHLHEYYRYLVQHPELLQRASQTIAKSSGATGEGLSLLGVAYGSGDEDDDQPSRSGSKQTDATVGHMAAGTSHSQEALVSNDVPKTKVDSGGSPAVQTKAVAATARPPKTGDGLGTRMMETISKPKTGDGLATKIVEGLSKGLPQTIKKKQTIVEGTAELIQPNKRIVPLPKIKDVPAKVTADDGSQPPKRKESKNSSWHSVPSVKDMNYGMSADAAAAVVLAATRGARMLKRDSSNIKSSSASGLSQKVQDANGQPVDRNGCKGNTSLGLGPSDAKLAKAVAELAAIAASHEADSADTLRTPAEKLKAERLRKAKMFAAMIKSGNGAQESAERQVERSLDTSPAAVSTKSEEMLKDGLSIDENAIVNGKGVSTESNPPAEEVEDSDITKSKLSNGAADLAIKQSVKERKYRTKDQEIRTDSEESKHQRKKKSHHDQKSDKKHRHSKRRKHTHYDSESAEFAVSSSDDSAHEHKSKTRHRHHKTRKRSHHECDGNDEKHGNKAHKSNNGDMGIDLSRKLNGDDMGVDSSGKNKHRRSRHSRHHDRTSCGSEEETSGSGRLVSKHHRSRNASVERVVVPILAHSSHGNAAENQTKIAAATEVPADIREKVRAMLLSTL